MRIVADILNVCPDLILSNINLKQLSISDNQSKNFEIQFKIEGIDKTTRDQLKKIAESHKLVVNENVQFLTIYQPQSKELFGAT